MGFFLALMRYSLQSHAFQRTRGRVNELGMNYPFKRKTDELLL